MPNTRHAWFIELAGLSSAVAALSLTDVYADEPYWDVAKKCAINVDAYKLSGSVDHNTAIACWIDDLSDQRVTPAQLTKLLADLTSWNTYGTFAELAAYGLLVESTVPFKIQVPSTGKDILNPNGSATDGCLEINGDVLFDVKAFALHEHLANRLQTRLANAFPGNFIALEGSGDVGVTEMNALLDRDFRALEAELRAQNYALRGALEIRLRPAAQRVQISAKTQNPYELAKNNAEYVFNYSKKFARRKPFILIFVLHPWMGGLRLTTNFANDVDIFTRSFARRTFMQFTRDRTQVLGVTRSRASKMLSGMMFVDAWQPPKVDRTHRLFLNPHAKRPISALTVDKLRMQVQNLEVDDFRHDVY